MLHSFLKRIQFLLFLSLSLLLLTACVNTGTSAYQYSREVENQFETPTLLEHHTYYYNGSESTPDAVIAIDSAYKMTSKVWAEIDVTPKILDNWAFQFNTYEGWWNCPYRGVILFAPDGRKVGVGYSKWTFSVIKMISPAEIVVYPPQAMGSCRRQERLDDR